MIERPIVVCKKRKIREIVEDTPERKAEKSAKLKKYLDKVATLEEEEAFLKKINRDEPDTEEVTSSESANSEDSKKSD